MDLKNMEPYWLLILTIAFLAIAGSSLKKEENKMIDYSGTLGS